ncbi:hypothetical protein ACFZA1_27410 [Streptomyces filipinensis]|uniref:hypothetical protein n=1 Tax=Streptomyces filipinensis TaxID=66887 RepID=UPI0036E8FB71
MLPSTYGDSRLSLWLRVREYAVPPSMIETATGRREAGDWAGACAAARIDVDLDLRSVARTHGRRMADRLRADLRRLAPDLLRWHMPRIAPDGLLRPGLTLTLARYDRPGRAGPLHLVARTPPAWAGAGQRISIAVWDPARPPAGGHPHPHPNRRYRLDLHRHLWDARTAADLRERAGADGGAAPRARDRAEADGSVPPRAGPLGLVPPAEGCAVGRWAAEAALLLAAEGRRGGPFAVRLGGRRRLALELVADPGGDSEAATRSTPAAPGAVDPVRRNAPGAPGSGPEPASRRAHVRRLPSADGHSGPDPATAHPPHGHPSPDPAGVTLALRVLTQPPPGGFSALPVLPDAATWVLPDLELLRAGLLAPGQLHPLVAAALAPGWERVDPVPDGDPAAGARLVQCRGATHRIGLVDGVLAPLDHDPAEIRREELLAALGGPPLPCLRAVDEAHRRPDCLAGVRERLDHGDTAGALAVVEALLGPGAVLRDGPLRDELAVAAERRVAHGLYRAGLTGSGRTSPAPAPRAARGRRLTRRQADTVTFY